MLVCLIYTNLLFVYMHVQFILILIILSKSIPYICVCLYYNSCLYISLLKFALTFTTW
jgi:hypothetical protein